MKNNKQLIALVIIALSASSASCAVEPQAGDSKYQERLALVRNMANMTLSILQDQKKSFAERQESMERGIINMVDIDRIARSVLGVAWRGASDNQRQRYTGLYRSYLTKMYIANFAQNKERKISDMKIIGIDNASEDSFRVNTELLLSNAGHLDVAYQVAEKGDEHKIIDISIEGVSLLVTHRAEFTDIAATRGVDGVIDTLQTLVSAEKPAMQVSSLQ